MLAESRNCGPGSGVVGLVDEPPPKEDKKLLGTGSHPLTRLSKGGKHLVDIIDDFSWTKEVTSCGHFW